MMEVTVPTFFKSLMVYYSLKSFQECDVDFQFTIFLGSGLNLAFPYNESPHSASKGTNVKILPVPEYVYSTYAFQNWRNNSKIVLDAH